MKKVLIFLCAIFLTTTTAQSASCNGGTLVTSNSSDPTSEHYYEECTSATCNEHTFCKSDRAMNWWSAVTWCMSQGRKLAEFSLMCPGRVGNADCPNLKNLGYDQWGWSITPSGSSNVNNIVSLSSGAVDGSTTPVATTPTPFVSKFSAFLNFFTFRDFFYSS